MEKLRVKLDWFISPVLYVLNAIWFPQLIKELRVNLRVYKECVQFIKQKLKYNEAFIQFLDANEFEEAWFGRLYSLQKLTDSMAVNLRDEDLNDYVLQLISHKWTFLIEQGFTDIFLMRTKRIDKTSYVLILEIGNFMIIKSVIIHMIFSAVVWGFILRLVYVYHTDTIITILHHIGEFLHRLF